MQIASSASNTLGEAHVRRLGHWVRRARGGAVGFALLLASTGSRADDPAYMVKNINTGPDPQFGSDPEGFAEIDKAVLFVAADDTHGWHLWRTDWTAAGTRSVSYTAANPGIVFQGQYYFHGPDGLYRSDGTQEGTFRVVNVQALPITVVGKTLYLQDSSDFGGDDCDGTWRLWASDGTPQGTHVLAQFDNDYYDPEFATAGRKLFFIARGSAGDGLWTSDGT